MNSKLCTCKARTRSAIGGRDGRDGWVSSRPRTRRSALGTTPKSKCWGVSELTSSNVFMSRILPASWLLCGRCRMGEPQPAAKVLPLSRIWLPASCEGCLCLWLFHCLCNPTFLTYCLAVMWEDVARLKGPPPLNVLQFAGVFIINFDQL